jgi:hypothetical protein
MREVFGLCVAVQHLLRKIDALDPMDSLNLERALQSEDCNVLGPSDRAKALNT